jgi:hypothetical protein
VVTAPRPGPRHEVGTFKVARSSPDRHRRERFRLRFLEINLELHWSVVKSADRTVTHRKQTWSNVQTPPQVDGSSWPPSPTRLSPTGHHDTCFRLSALAAAQVGRPVRDDTAAPNMLGCLFPRSRGGHGSKSWKYQVRNMPRIPLELVQEANAGTSSGSATKQP